MHIRISILFLLVHCFYFSNAQSSRDYAVELTASVYSTVPQIVLQWPTPLSATSIKIYKKQKGESSWGSTYATPSVSASSFADDSVIVGASYEYKLNIAYSTHNAYGYINSGIALPENPKRGTLIMLIDSMWYSDLQPILLRYYNQLESEGWKIKEVIAGRSETAINIKSKILLQYAADPDGTKAIFILGHVAVPYSGGFLPYPPDGHLDHICAWPADVYYGDLDGGWTDATVNNTAGSDSRNHNIPGDGKFDQESIPSVVELAVGRVDFFNMPSFTKSELQLLQEYLIKDLSYREAVFQPVYRALIDDNFGGFGGEAFAASAWKNFAPLLGDTASYSLDYLTELDTNNHSYLWSYGCGGGWYQGAGGIGSTSQLAQDSLLGLFNMMFGSYFGDWDVTDNFLRAQIAQGTTLTTCWSGRPHWYFHHMAMGESIYYSVLLTQNNTNLYHPNIAENMVHIALMGDPTLRMFVMKAPDTATAIALGTDVQIEWSATDAGMYNIYKFTDATDWIKLNNEPVNTTIFWDSCALAINAYYRVCATELTQSASGTFYNLSAGTKTNTVTTDACNVGLSSNKQVGVSIYPNPVFDFVNIILHEEIHSWRLETITGVVLSASYDNEPIQQIDMRSLPQSVYILKLVTKNNGEQLYKLIKQ